MRFKKGDRVVCISTIPNEKVVAAFGDEAYRWYKTNLVLNKIYTIIEIDEYENGWEELSVMRNCWVGEINFELLSIIRKQKLDKLK